MNLTVFSHVGLWTVAALLVFSVVVLARQVGILHERLPPWGAATTGNGPEIGSAVPASEYMAVDGTAIRLGESTDRGSLLVFVSEHCQTCQRLLAGLRAFVRSERAHLDVILVGLDTSPEGAKALARQHRLSGVPFTVDPEASTQFDVSMTPFGIAIDEDGEIRAKGTVNSHEHLESLVRALERGTPTFDDALHEGGEFGHERPHTHDNPEDTAHDTGTMPESSVHGQ